MSAAHRITRDFAPQRTSWISFLSFYRLLELLKWAAFVATLGLLYVQMQSYSISFHLADLM